MTIKDAMSVSFDLKSYLLTILVKYHRKNDFVEKMWPTNLALFIYVSTHYVKT